MCKAVIKITSLAALPAALSVALAGCAGKPVIQTQVVEKPVPVLCRVEIPEACKTVYAVNRVSVKDDALTINRALRAEIEERRACEVKLLAALKGCNSLLPPDLNPPVEPACFGSLSTHFSAPWPAMTFHRLALSLSPSSLSAGFKLKGGPYE